MQIPRTRRAPTSGFDWPNSCHPVRCCVVADVVVVVVVVVAVSAVSAVSVVSVVSVTSVVSVSSVVVSVFIVVCDEFKQWYIVVCIMLLCMSMYRCGLFTPMTMYITRTR